MTVVLDESNDVQTVRVVPDFSAARSVVGLDAHPSDPVWQANTVRPSPSWSLQNDSCGGDTDAACGSSNLASPESESASSQTHEPCLQVSRLRQ